MVKDPSRFRFTRVPVEPKFTMSWLTNILYLPLTSMQVVGGQLMDMRTAAVLTSKLAEMSSSYWELTLVQ